MIEPNFAWWMHSSFFPLTFPILIPVSYCCRKIVIDHQEIGYQNIVYNRILPYAFWSHLYFQWIHQDGFYFVWDMQIQNDCTKYAKLCFSCPEQIKEVPFCLTEFLLSTEFCKRACRISPRKTTRFTEWFEVCCQDDTSPKSSSPNVFRVLCKFGEVKRDKQGQVALVAFIKE